VFPLVLFYGLSPCGLQDEHAFACHIVASRAEENQPLTARNKKPLTTLTKKKESGKIKSPSQ
ncbi:MAG: hypothetical protein LBT33_04200, partial [Spirochaetia bacterium]|nr:hypothetical protein [Spirochaetia bacterium]